MEKDSISILKHKLLYLDLQKGRVRDGVARITWTLSFTEAVTLHT